MKKACCFMITVVMGFLASVSLQGQPTTFKGAELLGCTTDNSVLINVIPDETIALYYEYGTTSGSYSVQTVTDTATGGQPFEIKITGLSANTRYYYRLQYRVLPDGTWNTGAEYNFQTQRATGQNFVFAVTSDTHANLNTNMANAMTNVRNDNTDFLVDIGDTFYPQQGSNLQSQVDERYTAFRDTRYFGAIGPYMPIFLSSGNHEEEEGWNLDDLPFSIGVASIQARKAFYPTPVPDGFYTGNSDPLAAIDEAKYGDELREDYYAWEWGDALFVVIDEFQYTMNLSYTPVAGEGSDDAVSGDQWNWTLGEQQYGWLKETLENSTAKYKFVFSHNMLGGIPRDISVNEAGYVRGGAEAAGYFEWGGKNADGTDGFAAHRDLSKFEKPIHQLFVENGVSAYFHGHDHQYVYETRDGVVYQEVPSPGMAGSGFGGIYTVGSYTGYQTIRMLSSTGHLRVSVTPSLATVAYISSVSSTNGTVNYSYTIEPKSSVKYDLTISADPKAGGTTTPAPGVHSYTEGLSVAVTAEPATGYAFNHWEGDVDDPASASTHVTLSANKTITAVFESVPTYTLTLAIDPSGNGNITPAAGDHTYNSGSDVSIVAIPAAGFIFDHWSDNVNDPELAATTVLMDVDKVVTAYFVEAPEGSLAYLGDIGTAADNSSGTTLTITVGASGVAVGNTIIVGFASRGAQTYTDPTITDQAGNSYSIATRAVTYQHGRCYLYYAPVVNALSSGQTITITSTSVASRVAVASVFSGLLATSPLDQVLGNPTGTSTTNQGNDISVGPTGTTAQSNELVIGMVGTEESSDAGTGTWLNGFTAGPQCKTSGASYEWRVSMGYLFTTTPGTYTAAKTVTNSPYWAATIASFKTESVLSPDRYNIVLCRPSDNSITVSTIMDQDGSIYYQYGTSEDNLTGTTGTISATAGEPVELVINGLSSNVTHYYRLYFRQSESTTVWEHSDVHSFHTQRAKDATFTFTIISDSHLGQTFSGNTAARYNQTTLNVAADHPDFHIDLGDAFIMDDVISQSEADDVYETQRAYFGNFSHSSPVLLAIGNHENEEGWNLDDNPFSQALGSMIARKKYFPNPVPGAFYSGNNDLLAAIGGDQYREDYYAWEWGDALFIVLDPFQYTMDIPYSNVTGAGEIDDETVSGDQWNWTLGKQQYDWLKETLESSSTGYKFVFSHHLTGGQVSVDNSQAGPPAYVRGGAMAAGYFEWGGKNADDSEGFETKRSTWGGISIHQLLVNNGATAYFHGHDHQFVHEEIDGITYQLVPSPGMSGYGFDLYDSSPYAVSGGNLPDPGHLRVTVSPEETTVAYIQSVEGGGGANGQIAYSYAVEPSNPTSPAIVTTGTLTAFSSITGVPSAVQTYAISGKNLTSGITIAAPAGFELSTDGTTFSSTLSLPLSGSTVNLTTIYVRMNSVTDGTFTGNVTNAGSGAVTRNVEVSGTVTAPDFNILLGRPTDKSVTVNMIPDQNADVYFKYGATSNIYTGQTSTYASIADEPVEVVMNGLSSNTRYYYRLAYKLTDAVNWAEGEEHSFITRRPQGSTFTFTITSDSHLGQYGGQTTDEKNLYQQTILNVSADHPDFHLDLGDTYAMDPSPLGTGMTDAEAKAAYLVQRPYLTLFEGSIPFFQGIGNHENEEGWNFDDIFTSPDQSLARVGMKYRKLYYPNPVPDDFYTGNDDPLSEPIGGDNLREDYYAWTWGDALFVVIDPYHYSMTWPGEGDTYGGEGQDGEASGDRWGWSLGIKQYLWLKQTLENSNAKYKFVFTHQVTGGSTPYGRGGIGAAPYFEWGGLNADSTWGFDTHRPASEGWDLPVHQMMVENGVSVFFHGHDHIYSSEELDGIAYVECPKPDDAGYEWEPYGYGYNEGLYPNGLCIQNSGHLRVTVAPEETTIDYVRSYLPGDGTNREVANTITVTGNSVSSITVITPNGGENWQGGSGHNITWTSEGIGENVHIEYSANNGSAWTDIVASTENDGIYNWIVPNVSSENYLIRVSDTDGDPYDVSDATFKIESVVYSHVPHLVCGSIQTSTGAIPDEANLTFSAYILTRNDEILTQATSTSGNSEGYWWVQCASLPTGWIAGEVMHIDFTDAESGEVGSVEVTLTNNPSDNVGTVILGLHPPVILSYEIVNENDLQFTFDNIPASASFNAYRDTTAFFAPDKSGGTNRIATHFTDEDPGKTGVQWTDHNVIGYPSNNYFYIFTTVGGNESANSITIGEFDFNLITTVTTSFNEIALPLKIQDVSTAEDLMAAIPECNSVALWDAGIQGYYQYVPAVHETNFEVKMGYPYYVNVADESVFTLVGEIAEPKFNLITTSATCFNDVMMTLDKTGIEKASGLMSDIPTCNSVAKWSADIQGYYQYVPQVSETNFGVRVGYPYYVNVQSDVTWPDNNGSLKSTRSEYVIIEKSSAPHLVYGSINNYNSGIAVNDIDFAAYFPSNPEEKLSKSSAGSILKDGYYLIQCNAFPSGWKTGEALRVEFRTNNGVLLGTAEVPLSYNPADKGMDLVLADEGSCSLSQNKPNPFSDETLIEYQIADDGPVMLEIYSLTGQKIRTLVNENRPSGIYEVTWNGCDGNNERVPAGVYIYVLKSRDYVVYKKAAVTK